MNKKNAYVGKLRAILVMIDKEWKNICGEKLPFSVEVEAKIVVYQAKILSFCMSTVIT